MSKKTEKRSLWTFWLGTALGLVLGGVAACAVTLAGFRPDQPYQPIEEAKICYVNLNKDRDRSFLTPQTREYMKERLYSNAADYINRGWLSGWEWDFGPVDEEALLGINAIKNASTPEEVYEAALDRH